MNLKCTWARSLANYRPKLVRSTKTVRSWAPESNNEMSFIRDIPSRSVQSSLTPVVPSLHRVMNKVLKPCVYDMIWSKPYASSVYCSIQVRSNQTSASAVQQLPRLPVPPLKDTLRKYLRTVKPHLSDGEFSATTAIVHEFEKGVGQELQNLLMQRAESHTNWLEEWWLNTAYLGYRDPVVVYSSPGLVFPFQKFSSQDDQLKHAAKILSAALDYKYLIDSDKIPVEMMGKNPLDMSQYKKIFGTCRVPQEKRDRLSYNSDSQHATIMHNNHIFRLDLWGEDSKRLSECQLLSQLREIVNCSQSPAKYPIGILTSDNRDNWAKAYEVLSKDEMNRRSLEDIEKSLVVLSLDSATGLWKLPNKDAQQNLAARQTIHGGGPEENGGNRWFDKTIQFIVGADGVTGLTYEHSPAEGQPIAVMTDFIINFIEKGQTSKDAQSSVPRKPIKLNFEVNSEVAAFMNQAKENLNKLASDLELNCFTYRKYGKNVIKSQKMSPDSYIQMAMQFAFYRLHKTPGAHYESAATRMYAGGRTETIRSCSEESIEFAKIMLSNSSNYKEKMAAMRKAIDSHKNYTVQALQGLGVDRHLLGLKLIAMENGMELPKLYHDVGFKKSAHMRISTSQVACKCDGFMCYGPLVPDGYATCYNPRNEDMNFATSSFISNPETSCTRYRKALEQSLEEMHNVLLHNTPSKL